MAFFGGEYTVHKERPGVRTAAIAAFFLVTEEEMEVLEALGKAKGVSTAKQLIEQITQKVMEGIVAKEKK